MKRLLTIAALTMIARCALAQWVPIGVDTNTWVMKPIGFDPIFTNYYNQLMWSGTYEASGSGGSFELDPTNINVSVGLSTPVTLRRVAGIDTAVTFDLAASNTSAFALSTTSLYFSAGTTSKTFFISGVSVTNGAIVTASATAWGGIYATVNVAGFVDPATLDADDDGYTDLAEQDGTTLCGNLYGSSPYDSMSPRVQRSWLCSGTPAVLETNGNRLGVSAWTIECNLRLTNTTSGTLIERTIDGTPVVSYRVAISNNLPVVEYNDPATNSVRIVGPGALPVDEWVHLAASCGGTNNRSLWMSINGNYAQSRPASLPAASGAGTVRAGGLACYVDNLRLWSEPRTEADLRANIWRIIGTASNQTALLSEYRFDDGGTTAEDFAARTNASRAVSGVTFASNVYALCINFDDADSDWLPDWFEEFYFGGTTNSFPTEDPDGDGLRNDYEYQAGCNPLMVDSDNDGIWDSYEDSDSDGLVELIEQQWSTDPRLADTDDDGIPDGIEASLADGSSGFDPRTVNGQLCDGSDDTLLVIGGSTSSWVEIEDNGAAASSDWIAAVRFVTTQSYANSSAVAYTDPTTGGTMLGSLLMERYSESGDHLRWFIDKSGNTVAAWNGQVYEWVTGITADKLPDSYALFCSSTGGVLTLYVNAFNAGSYTNRLIVPSPRAGGRTLYRIGRGHVGAILAAGFFDSTNYPLLNSTLTVYPTGAVVYLDFRNDYSSRSGTNQTADIEPTSGREYQSALWGDAGGWSNAWERAGTIVGTPTRSHIVDYTNSQPYVVYVSSTNANGTYTNGQTVTINVKWSEPITAGAVGSKLYLDMAVPKVKTAGPFASYFAGDGTDTITYTNIIPGSTTGVIYRASDLDYWSTNALVAGASAFSNAATAANGRLPIPRARGSLSWNKNIAVSSQQ